MIKFTVAICLLFSFLFCPVISSLSQCLVKDHYYDLIFEPKEVREKEANYVDIKHKQQR